MKLVKNLARLVAIAVLYIIHTALSAIVFIPIVVFPIVMGLLCATCRDVLNDAGHDGDSFALDTAKEYMQAVNKTGRSFRQIFINFGKF